jgi:hypothetical protein
MSGPTRRNPVSTWCHALCHPPPGCHGAAPRHKGAVPTGSLVRSTPIRVTPVRSHAEVAVVRRRHLPTSKSTAAPCVASLCHRLFLAPLAAARRSAAHLCSLHRCSSPCWSCTEAPRVIELPVSSWVSCSAAVIIFLSGTGHSSTSAPPCTGRQRQNP